MPLLLQMLGLSVWNKATMHYELKDGVVNRATGTTRLVSYLNLRTSLNGGVISRCVCEWVSGCVCRHVCVWGCGIYYCIEIWFFFFAFQTAESQSFWSALQCFFLYVCSQKVSLENTAKQDIGIASSVDDAVKQAEKGNICQMFLSFLLVMFWCVYTAFQAYLV